MLITLMLAAQTLRICLTLILLSIFNISQSEGVMQIYTKLCNTWMCDHLQSEFHTQKLAVDIQPKLFHIVLHFLPHYKVGKVRVSITLVRQR